MKKITDKDLLKLGFKKEVENSDDNPFHYYVYEIDNQCLLISCANDETIDDGYEIELFENHNLKTRDLDLLIKFIDIIKLMKNG